MESCVLDYLDKKGYSVNTNYYSLVNNWINEWKGKSNWLDVRTIENKKYPMYSLGMAKRVCEDLASIITSEPFNVKASRNDELLQDDLEKAKILEKLPKVIEIMAYSGTVATVTRIVNAELNNEKVVKGNKTKIKTINIKGNQIIPLTIEDDEIINCAFVSEQRRKIDNKILNVIYLEIHELEDKGYQVTNVFFNKENGQIIHIEGVVDTYNTLSNVPLFSICKLPKENIYDDNNGLGMALYGDSEDQLQILDLVYNNFGLDFKLGQKIMVINKKLTKIETEEYTDKDGTIRTRAKVMYPSDLQKQQFMEITDGIMGDGTNQNPYIYEYNPDLRVGDNKEGIQFALDNLSFKVGYGTHYYNFEKGDVTRTATEALLSRKDFVDNGVKNRSIVNEYLIGVCKSILLCEKILGANVDENQDIEIELVDGFLQDDETERQKLLNDVSAGLISHKRYLMKAYNMTEEEAIKELQDIQSENNIDNIEITEEDMSE